MPELPEVETVRRRLSEALVGDRIEDVRVMHTDVVRLGAVSAFVESIRGQEIQAVERRGKYLVFKLSESAFLCHLRMTGRLLLTTPAALLAAHTHLSIGLGSGRELRYQDTRRFGGFYLLGPGGEGAPAGYCELGPEPLGRAFTAEVLGRRLAGQKRGLKAALLDQATLAGLGNIYVDESLFRARLHPSRVAGMLTPDEHRRLHRAIRSVLKVAIAQRGTTFSDYLDSDGQPGSYAQRLSVFRKEGTACPRCGHVIVKRSIAGRGTHFCPNCQPGGDL